MSIPVTTNTPSTGSPGCSPVSSSCVVWQGPDIPCINLCKGDSIEKVVYDLATLLCSITEGVLDVTTLDFKCLVEEGQTNPATLLATIQAIINKVCDIEANCCGEGSGGTTPDTPAPIALPVCLYYTEDGDEITQLLPQAYSQYLAEQICLLITSITGAQSAITALTLRVTAVESAVEAGSGGSGDEPLVTSQCASSSTPGFSLPISEAFTNFETKFCQLQSLLGSNAAISTAIAKECTDLDISNQLSNPGDTMSELSGWVVNPTNLSQTIVNMWLTICDMRTALISASGGATAECALVPPFNVQITNIQTTSFKVQWNIPQTGLYETPANFTVTVKEWNGTAAIGSTLGSAVKTYPTAEHTFTGIGNPDKVYIVEVAANYTCGTTEKVYTIGKIKLSNTVYQIKVEDVVKATPSITTMQCNGSPYPVVERLTTVTLVNPVTGEAVTNTGAAVNVVLRYNNIGDCVGTAQENITVSIATGQSSGTYAYLGERPRYCIEELSCSTEYKSYTCAVSVTPSTVGFASSVYICGSLVE